MNICDLFREQADHFRRAKQKKTSNTRVHISNHVSWEPSHVSESNSIYPESCLPSSKWTKVGRCWYTHRQTWRYHRRSLPAACHNLKIHLTSSRRCFSGSSSFMIRSFSARFFSSRRDWAASCLCTWVSLRKFSSTRALFLSAFCLPFLQRKANVVNTDSPWAECSISGSHIRNVRLPVLSLRIQW